MFNIMEAVNITLSLEVTFDSARTWRSFPNFIIDHIPDRAHIMLTPEGKLLIAQYGYNVDSGIAQRLECLGQEILSIHCESELLT